jgi:hypothetical protein
MTEHDWGPPPGNGNIWKCRRCGACTTCDRDPSTHPNYSTPSGLGYSSVLGAVDRDCDMEIVVSVNESRVPTSPTGPSGPRL